MVPTPALDVAGRGAGGARRRRWRRARCDVRVDEAIGARGGVGRPGWQGVRNRRRGARLCAVGRRRRALEAAVHVAVATVVGADLAAATVAIPELVRVPELNGIRVSATARVDDEVVGQGTVNDDDGAAVGLLVGLADGLAGAVRDGDLCFVLARKVLVAFILLILRNSQLIVLAG